MKIATLLCALAVLLAGLVATAAGAVPHPGALDRSFSGNGIALRGFGQEAASGGAEKAALQPDGRVLTFLPRWEAGFSIARFGPDGGLDPSFGDGGHLAADFGVPGSVGTDFAVQPDGKIVVVGWAPRTGPKTGTLWAVARFLPDGAPDPSFGGGGSVTFPGKPRFFDGDPGAVVLQPDGRIVLVGVPIWTPRTALELVRLDPGGGLDRSFGGDGFVSVTLTERSSSFLNNELGAIAIDDGKLTVAVDGESERDRVYRFLADGSLDPGFGGGDGRVDGEFAGHDSDLAIDAADRIVISDDYGRVTRLLPDGSLDPGFGKAGAVRLDTKVKLRAVSALADGQLLLAGVANEHPDPGPREFLLVRLDGTGQLDPAFGGGDGIVASDLVAGSHDEATTMLAGAAGGVVLAGVSTPTDETGWARRRIVLARYGPAGDLDPGFGAGGVVLAQPRMLAADAVFDLAAGPRGTLVATGRAAGGIAVLRYRADGRPDPRFGERGVVRPSLTGSALGEQGESLLALPDGGLLVGTSSADGGALLRLRPGGAPDPGFGRRGVVRPQGVRAIVDMVRLDDGKILVAAILSGGTWPQAVLQRYLPGGALDRRFGERGSARFGEVEDGFARADVSLAVGRRGRIVAVARAFAGSRVEEYSAAGEPVEGFGRRSNGRRDQARPGTMTAVAIDRSGRIVLAGTRKEKISLVRLLPSGVTDRSFGVDGVVETRLQRWPYSSSAVADVEVEADGSVVVAGSTRKCFEPSDCPSGEPQIDPAVVRYRPDGSLDRGFAKRGAWIGKGQNGGVGAIALVPGGMLLGGWRMEPGAFRQMLVARLHR